jgi:hypothetical protein
MRKGCFWRKTGRGTVDDWKSEGSVKGEGRENIGLLYEYRTKKKNNYYLQTQCREDIFKAHE